MMNKRMALIAAVATLVLSGCASMSGPKSIVDVAASNPDLSTLNKLINDAGLADTLRASGPYTVFAPTNEAFKAVPAKTLDELGRDKEALKNVLAYHVLPGTVTSADVKTGNLKTLQGANVAVAKAGTIVTVEDAMVVRADVPASNGVVQVVDRVLMPPKK
jgi:uncharacterized surface protein with fasciclin (FAS1) repeats